MSLTVEVRHSDVIYEDEQLSSEERAERLAKWIAATIADHARRGWQFRDAHEVEGCTVLRFHHTLPNLW